MIAQTHHPPSPTRMCWLLRVFFSCLRSDESPHYEGADSDTLYPPGSLEMDDPGHPTDIAQPDLQGKVLRPEAKPYMNIQVRTS